MDWNRWKPPPISFESPAILGFALASLLVLVVNA